MDDYVAKPVSLKALDAALERWVPAPGPLTPIRRCGLNGMTRPHLRA